MSQDKPVLTREWLIEERKFWAEQVATKSPLDIGIRLRIATCDLALSALDRQGWISIGKNLPQDHRQLTFSKRIFTVTDTGEVFTLDLPPLPPAPHASAQTVEKINEPPQAGRDALTAPSQEGHVAGPAAATPELPIPNARLAEDFGDPETLLNSRSWLQKAVEAKGAKIVGGGCGCGQADIDVVLEGYKFNISIRPI